MDFDKLYQKIGEYIVCFQGIENRFREIGWLIIDPNRNEFPPTSFRNDTNYTLLNKVKELYFKLIDNLEIDDGENRKKDFNLIVNACHEMRKYRNNLLHSAFIELKSNREVVGIVISNPKLKLNYTDNDYYFDQEVLSEKDISDKIAELNKVLISLNLHYTQLVHWSPFDNLEKTKQSN